MGKYLGIDTTCTLRRHANYSLTLLLCSVSGLAFDLEYRGRAESRLDASKLEAKASLELVRDSRGTDGHVENAEMMKERFFEFNKKKCIKRRCVGPTKCSLEIDKCIHRHVELSEDLYGVHAEAVLSFTSTHTVEVGGRLKFYKREQI